MNRSTARLVIAAALAAYGLYAASHVLGMVVGTLAPILLAGFILQVVSASAAAVGVWRDRRWAAGALMLVGVTVAATWLIEAFVLGIVAYLPALAAAAIAVIVTFGVATYVASRSKD
jgi:hypothetical protein